MCVCASTYLTTKSFAYFQIIKLNIHILDIMLMIRDIIQIQQIDKIVYTNIHISRGEFYSRTKPHQMLHYLGAPK